MEYDLKLLFLFILIILYTISSGQNGRALSQADIPTMQIMQNNALIALSIPSNVDFQVLLSARSSINALQEEIIHRESSGDPKICNKKYGCGSGMGLCGFISSTWNRTIDRMTCSEQFDTTTCIESYLPIECYEKVSLPMKPYNERDEAIFNTECHMIVCEWLLTTDGIRHWESEDGSWGSGPYDLTEY